MLAIDFKSPFHSVGTYHGRQNIGQGTGQLEHDDRNGNSDVHDST